MKDLRKNRFAMRISEEESKMIAELAEIDAVSDSDAVRLALRRVYKERLEKKTDG